MGTGECEPSVVTKDHSREVSHGAVALSEGGRGGGFGGALVNKTVTDLWVIIHGKNLRRGFLCEFFVLFLRCGWGVILCRRGDRPTPLTRLCQASSHKSHRRCFLPSEAR